MFNDIHTQIDSKESILAWHGQPDTDLPIWKVLLTRLCLRYLNMQDREWF